MSDLHKINNHVILTSGSLNTRFKIVLTSGTTSVPEFDVSDGENEADYVGITKCAVLPYSLEP